MCRCVVMECEIPASKNIVCDANNVCVNVFLHINVTEMLIENTCPIPDEYTNIHL